MGLFQRSAPHRTPEPAPNGAPWLNHGFRGGEQVQCTLCSAPLTVKLFDDPSRLIVGREDAMQGLALICADCGQLLCAACCLSVGVSECHLCGGPVSPLYR